MDSNRFPAVLPSANSTSGDRLRGVCPLPLTVMAAPGATCSKTRIATRRLALRPSAESFGCLGWNSPKPTISSRSGSMPCFVNWWTTLAARAADNSQLDGNDEVRIGLSSVWPSTRMGLGNGFSTSPSLSSTGSAWAANAPEPLGNRISVLISISSHMFSRRTVTSLASISACMAFCTWRSIRMRAPGRSSCAKPFPTAGSRGVRSPPAVF